MADRDWDKELAKIDAQLRSIPEEDQAPARPTPGRSALAGPAAIAGVGSPIRSGSRAGAFLRLGLAGTLAVAMLVWPFDARCGLGLAAYLGSVLVVALAGGWSAIWTWRHRTPRAHIVALAIVLWGFTLGALEILPRAGYGPATIERPRVWSCG
ncbi:MAG TPA: hypothetical protein VMM18_00220 [Gemmatimonadaceae bacterium]|nr:hypothetical protein [Gemmatimonadaceae bacterium]